MCLQSNMHVLCHRGDMYVLSSIAFIVGVVAVHTYIVATVGI